MKLFEVIEKVEKYIHEKRPIVNSFTNPKKLVEALYELNNMVEMESAKDIISRHLCYILTTNNFKNELLNTMIYGPPGVGKTEIGTILAKIWASVGILKRNKVVPLSPKKLTEKSILEHRHKIIKQRYEKLKTNPRGNIVKKIKIYALQLFTQQKVHIDLDKVISYLKTNPITREKFGRGHTNIIDMLTSHSEFMKNSLTMHDDIMSVHRVISQNEITLTEPELGENVIEDEKLPFIIAKPHDFIGQYIGETSIKSEKFLEDNKGKVIFIDEAYTLAEKRYGLEALTVINRAITERPDDFIFQFGGYKELMRGINDIQPGLDRRCSFVIDIRGYSPEGLLQIYIKQLKELGKNIKEEDMSKIKDFITANKDKFTHYGGDTKKLTYYSNIEHCLDLFKNETETDNLITYSQFTKGFKCLIDNKPEKEISEAPQHMYT